MRAFLILSATRWLPVGFTVATFALVALERGLTVGQIGSFMAVQGIVVFLLELPTSGLADVVGRRPLLLIAGAFNLGAGLLYIVADTFWVFAAAAALMGVYRALDSGPLEAWYVDVLHASEPGADPDRAMARQGVVAGVAMAVGSLAAGGLIAWHPVRDASALLLPLQVYVALGTAHVGLTALLMREPRRRESRVPGTARATVRATLGEAAQVARDGVGLLRTGAVLRSTILVTAFWAFGMVVFEAMQPVRLAELLGSQAQAGAIMGPVAAAAWAVFALGSAAAEVSFKRIGVARTALAARALNGVGAVVMGLAVTPVGLIGAYLPTYGLHGSAGAAHAVLLHREASARNRSTVLSLNSMVGFIAWSLAVFLVTRLAEVASNQVAMVVAGGVSIVGLALYLPALKQERRGEVS